jgi:hypothetical protein
VFEALKRLDTELVESAIDPRDTDSSAGDSTVMDTRCSHWAVGWVETVYVHASNVAACKRADEILGKLADYPVFNDEHFSQLEDEDCRLTWESLTESDRVGYLRDHCGRFDKRSNLFRDLRAAVKGSWRHAANLLPCPSEILS